MSDYETIEHTADIGIRARGRSLGELFANAAAGMFSLICEPSQVRARETFPVRIEAEDMETLLVEWLNELLFLHESRGVVLGRFQVGRVDDHHLEGTALGEKLDPGRHILLEDIKAVTYHMLRIEQADGSWQATVIFDV
jgi:SHS2 domain-containing protein